MLSTPASAFLSAHALRLAVLVAAVAIPTTACKGGAAHKDQGHASGSAGSVGSASGAPAQAAPDPERAENAKLEAAIECLNSNSERVFEVRDGYLADVDPATGVPLRAGPMNLMGLGSAEPCERKVKAAAALTPAIPELDKASADYVAALAGFRAVWDQLDAYYKKGEHLDDKAARARELHPKVMAAVDGFAAANAALHRAVEDRNRRRHQAALAALEQREGRNLEVIIGTLMLEAQTLLGLTEAPAIDAAALAAQLTTYGALVDEVDAYAGAHADEAARWGSLTNVRNYSKAFLAASKAVGRDGTPASRDEAMRQYNFLVDNFNNH